MALETLTQDKIRNVAIIAHVDHGKTTLVDAFLKQSHLFRDNQHEMSQTQILDSNELEREKGITILAKNISIRYKGHKINIIDTPGHSDFSGEVERTLNMADGAVLVVDSQEGVMPQTEFVLKKAFELGLKIIVVVNKIDKKYANIKKTEKELDDLFLKLAKDDDQLDFSKIYAVGRFGKAWKEIPSIDLQNEDEIQEAEGSVEPLLDRILEYIPAPKVEGKGNLLLQITSLDNDAHLGRYLIGKIHRGSPVLGQRITVVKTENDKVEKITSGTISKLLVKEGLDYVEVEKAVPGDIVAITGVETTAIGATICDSSDISALPDLKISPPTVKIKFEQSSSPFAGKEGEFVTAKQIQQRMEYEKDNNIGLKIEQTEGGGYYVSGRGELQLSILIETMRREGYEFQVRRPEVILLEEDGIKKEPLEDLTIIVAEEYFGKVTETLSNHKATMNDMKNEHGIIEFKYSILTRNLFGLRMELINKTKGTAILHSYVDKYVAYKPTRRKVPNGVMVATNEGTSTGYSLNTLQERGSLFIGAGIEVYEGMIVGISKYENDLDVNVCKARHQSGVRVKHDEITQTALVSPIQLTLEYALVFLKKDEMLEVTPKSLRLRKISLKKTDRERDSRGKKESKK